MTKVAVLLAPNDVLRDAYFSPDTVALAKENLSRYTRVEMGEFALVGTKDSEWAAEEMFNLTNNPSRQAEREEVYGRRRSVSVGDVVDVGGELMLCASSGWDKM